MLTSTRVPTDQDREPKSGMSRIVTINDFEKAALKKLPAPIFDLIAGGAGDEITLATNQEYLKSIRLRPRSLRDVSVRDISTTVFGEKISLPVMLAPVGYQRMAHREGELAAARAAGAAGTGFILSSTSAYRLEDVAAVASTPRWFQAYVPPERALLGETLARARKAGYSALCITVDTPMYAVRDRDLRNRLTVPMKLQSRMIAAAALRPLWSIDFLRGGVGRGFAKTRRWPATLKEAGQAMARPSVSVTRQDIEWIRSQWKGPLIVKGVLRGDDAAELVSVGVDGIVVSNHGGRQLDGAVATIEALAEIADVAGGKVEIFIDGGFRRGVDVLKAIALGAKAVLIGRPFVYGLAVAGQKGAERVLDIFRQEIDTALGLMGCRTLADLDRSCLKIAGPSTHPLAPSHWEEPDAGRKARSAQSLGLMSVPARADAT